MKLSDPRNRWKLGVFFGISGSFMLLILWKHLTEHTTSSPEAGPIALNSNYGPCEPERLLLACQRAMDKGWPACILAPGGTRLIQGAIPTGLVGISSDFDVKHGSIGYDADRNRYVILSQDATCEVNDWTLEHEVICHLDYKIGHLNHAGSLCESDRDRMGTEIPRRVEPEV